jgi:hypothetical protein
MMIGRDGHDFESCKYGFFFSSFFGGHRQAIIYEKEFVQTP